MTWLRGFVEHPDIDMNIRDQFGQNAYLAACSCRARYEEPPNPYVVPYGDREKQAVREFEHSCLALAESPIHGPKTDYLAKDNEGRHLWHHGLEGPLSCSPELVQRLLSIPGIRDLIRERDNAGFLPLHLALDKASIPFEICELFTADNPTDLLEPDPNGDSALHHIIRRERWSSLKPLAERYHTLGGDFNARNDVGESPLHVLPFPSMWKQNYEQCV